MLNQIQNPYMFWNSPIFTKQKSLVKPPRNIKITYRQASRYADVAKTFFKEKINADEIRLRKPEGKECANVLSIIRPSYETLKIETGNTTCANHFKTLTPAISYQFRWIAYLMKNKRYEELIKEVNNIIFRYPQMIILPIYGYIAAICLKSTEDERKFHYAIEHNFCEDHELHHFNHLIDELCTLPQATQYPPLLHLLKDDVNDLFEDFAMIPHILPVLVSNMHPSQYPIHFAPQFGSGGFVSPVMKIMDNLNLERANATACRPRLELACEDFELIPSKGLQNTPIVDLLKMEKFKEVISITTKAIKENPKLDKMYVSRAYAFVELGLIPNAISDLMKSLEISPSKPVHDYLNNLWKAFN